MANLGKSIAQYVQRYCCISRHRTENRKNTVIFYGMNTATEPIFFFDPEKQLN